MGDKRNELASRDAEDFEEAAISFLRCFEVVFHYDWTYTTTILGRAESWDKTKSDGITLLETGWEDYDDEIKCLSGLLCAYRRFVHVLRDRGVPPLVSDPPPDDWIFDRCHLPSAWRDNEAEAVPKEHGDHTEAVPCASYDKQIQDALGNFALTHGFFIGITGYRTSKLLSKEFAINVDRRGLVSVGLASRPDLMYPLRTVLAFLSKEPEFLESANLAAEALLLEEHADSVLNVDLLMSADLREWSNKSLDRLIESWFGGDVDGSVQP